VYLKPERLGAREYYARRSLTLARSLRKSLRAEEHVTVKQNKEMEAFRQAMGYKDAGEKNARRQAQYALSVARAVLETTSAEKRLAISLVRGAEIYLQSTHDMADAMDESVMLAEQQLGDLLEAAHSRGLPTAERLDGDIDQHSRATSRPHFSWQNSDENDISSDTSDSESISFYDVCSESGGGLRLIHGV
jgi:hypothetical protein